ncbi:ATP-binding protein [Paraburkholderia hospita]|jgi:DNA replication protein DnaC|uniref:ATP-binding protein n=1 Tax=Paraburkholderia hospita TaxID=169430 RepID=A0AAN1JM54_9BURK|nr:IS21-like element helper ATPase IstB [Paraburkholderia hospita]SKC83492.1 IstB transposition helper protein [Burkholderia sp. CF099]AUT75544.1 ATP-binding protein [Paraburkholderia hospita]SKC97345.1 IstB transposition helper protein [Burkholderia sp. CF099]SKD04120.1 IstB transposition helper protein [Burkholderia sp. CF099]SKD05180.1 IstB transposition helper protein [Burkholderia sp. CF099]
MTSTTINNEVLRLRAKALRLNGLVEHWSEIDGATWLAPLLQWEEDERAHRSLQRRIRAAKLGKFKAMADFDWSWPARIDRAAVEDLMSLTFLADATNVVFVGPNGVGKSTLAQNMAHHALIQGHTVLFKSASEMLGELAALDSDSALRRRLHHYATPDILVIDEVGYLSYSNRHADLLFELVSRRYEAHSTIITTNKPFKEWSDVFPNAACVVSLVDRLVHRAEVISIEGESYRLKEARERNEARARQRKTRKPPTKTETA